jgi:predicted nucleotidyltransferase
MPTIDLSFLPPTSWDQRELGELFSELVNAGGDNLESLIVFGSAATGSFDPATSDINLLVMLRRDDRDVLEAIKPPLSRLMRQFKVSPMVATGDELRTSADVFPVKFLTIKDHHRVLFGADPFEAMTIRRVHLRLRCEQEL